MNFKMSLNSVIVTTQPNFQPNSIQLNYSWGYTVTGLNHPTTPPPQTFKQLQGNIEQQNLAYKLS